MKVSVNNLSGCSKEVHVEVPVETVQVKLDELYRKISQEAKLPGFRKGKAPLDQIKKQYKSNVREEMVQHQLPEFFRTVLIEQKIDPVAQPQITHLQFEEGAPMKFVAMVEIKPEFKLKDYKGLKVKKESLEVGEKELEKALEEARDQFAQFVPVEDRPAQTDDLVVIDFEGKIKGAVFEGGKAERYPVLLGSQSLLKDFEANLIGMGKGGTKTFKIKFPEDYGKKDVAGQEAEFTVTLQEIKAKKLPALDDEFAKSAGQCETLSEFKEKISAQLKSSKGLEQRAKMVEQIGEKLISDHSFDVPVSLVNMEQQRLVQQGVERLRRQGMDVNKMPDDQKKQFVEQLRPVAQKNVQMALIVEKVAGAEGIHCEDKDFDAYVEKVSKNVNQPADAVRRYLQKEGVEPIREWIQYEKTLDFLISAAKVEAA